MCWGVPAMMGVITGVVCGAWADDRSWRAKADYHQGVRTRKESGGKLRRRNLIRDGQSTSTGQVINDGTDRLAVLQTAIDAAGFHRKQSAHRSHNATHPYLRRGIGLATFYHGAGFTGAGEVFLASRLQVAGLSDGRVEILSAQTEMERRDVLLRREARHILEQAATGCEDLGGPACGAARCLQSHLGRD